MVIIDFVACPNHIDNQGWDKLAFISPTEIKCTLCSKEFTIDEIRKMMNEDYRYKVYDLQRWYANNLREIYKDLEDKMNKFLETINEASKIEREK